MPNDSGTGLPQLEYEFATNPNSEAFIPLAEAYLEKGRFVEAMVVCKKGIKAHPDLPDGRLIMARIYSDQAKHQKAIDELNSLLKLSPQNADAFRLLGKIHLKLGRNDEGVDCLKKTLEANPADDEARDELLKRGIDYQPATAQPEPAPAAAAAPATGEVPLDERPTQREMDPVAGQTGDQIPARQPAAGQPQATVQPPAAGQPQATPAAQPARPRKRIADIYMEIEQNAAEPKRTGIKLTLIISSVLLVALAIYVIYTYYAGKKQEEINAHLEDARIKFKRDTYAGYTDALAHYRAIFKLEKEHREVLARGGFICAVLVGEYSAEGDYLKEGQKYLNEALSLDMNSPMLTTAEALMTVHAGGSSNEAIKTLQEGLKLHSESPQLHSALGLVLLERGELGEAKEHLLAAANHRIAPHDIRSLLGLGQYAMRRSLYREASRAFNQALQSNSDHVRSVLGVVKVSLVRGTEDVYQELADKKLEQFHSKLAESASERSKTQAAFLTAVLEARDRKKRKAALGRIDALLKEHPTNSMFNFMAAREYRRYGERARARGQKRLAKKRIDRAKELISRALRADSTRPDFVLEEAAIYLALEDYEATRARALRVQRMDAESGQSLLLAGDAYKGEKNWDKAKEYYEKAREFDDAEAVSHYKLAQVFLHRPKPDRDQAQAELEIAVSSLAAIGERRLAAKSATMLASIYADKNRPSEFIEIIQRAIKIDPSYAPPHALLSGNLDLSTADGRQAAEQHCTKYLELAPRGEYVDYCRKVLKQVR